MRRYILWGVLALVCLTLTAGPAGAGGTLKWAFTAEWTVNSPALGRDGTIYASSRDGKLYAVNSGGFQKWAFDTLNQLESSPAVGADGTIYVGSTATSGKLYAVDPNGNQHRATSAFVPFGGAKESGLGRAYSSLGLKSYMEPEVVSVAKQ